MSKCVKCGAELREDLNFCTKCGHKIEDEETIIKKKVLKKPKVLVEKQLIILFQQ